MNKITHPHLYHVMSTQVCWLKLKSTGVMITNYRLLIVVSHLSWVEHQTSLCHHPISLDQLWFDLLSLGEMTAIAGAQFQCRRILQIRLVLSESRTKLFPFNLFPILKLVPSYWVMLSFLMRINSYWIFLCSKNVGKWFFVFLKS